MNYTQSNYKQYKNIMKSNPSTDLTFILQFQKADFYCLMSI